MKKVVIASKNPVKISATEDGFKAMLSEEVCEFVGIPAESNVSDQPKSDEETLRGAKNRALNAQKIEPEADFWVGQEGGVEDIDHGLSAFAWIAILSKDGRMSIAKTGTWFLPDKIANLIREGHEMGTADDMVFGETNSKQNHGGIGLMTGNVITRKLFYEQAVITALIPFKNPTLFD